MDNVKSDAAVQILYERLPHIVDAWLLYRCSNRELSVTRYESVSLPFNLLEVFAKYLAAYILASCAKAENMSIEDAEDKISHGGKWLGAARTWMQSKIRFGDTLCWSSSEIVHVDLTKLYDLANVVVTATLLEANKTSKKAEA